MAGRTKPTLDIDADPDFQRREWRWQQIGLTLLVLFVAAAVLGLTGNGGPLNRRSVEDPSGAIRVDYERVVRRGSPSPLRLHVHSDPPGFVRFYVSTGYLDAVTVESISPAPESVTVETARHVYTIRAGSPDVTIEIDVQHRESGSVRAEIGLVEGPSVSFGQFSLF